MILTPEQRAEQLVREYYTFGINKEGQTLSWLESKQCALIAVKFAQSNPLNKDSYNEYLQEIKQEIEKL
jgi:hypothetical protein